MAVYNKCKRINFCLQLDAVFHGKKIFGRLISFLLLFLSSSIVYYPSDFSVSSSLFSSHLRLSLICSKKRGKSWFDMEHCYSFLANMSTLPLLALAKQFIWECVEVVHKCPQRGGLTWDHVSVNRGLIPRCIYSLRLYTFLAVVTWMERNSKPGFLLVFTFAALTIFPSRSLQSFSTAAKGLILRET